MISYPNVFDLSKQAVDKTLECDVLIVGSGAGGGVAAEILSRAGLSVIIIEEGPLKTANDFNMLESEAYAELYQEVASRKTLDQSIQILQGRAVGGSTTVNWTASFRTPDQTLNFWQRNFGVSGLDSENLLPWFEWVEKRLNIEPWEIPPNANNRLLAEGAARLGWKHHVISRNVKGCANLGYCGTGCPLNAKQSMLVTCIPAALNLGTKLLTRARLESLLFDKERVTGGKVSAMNENGQVAQLNAYQIKAAHTVLSAGAIGTPAILLRSNFDKKNSAVGKRTMLHPVTASIAEMSFDVSPHSGAPQSVYSDEFLWRDGISGELGYKIEVPPLHPVLASTLLRFHGSWHYEMMQKFNRLQANLSLLRDGFHEESQGGRVLLDNYQYPHLDYPISGLLWQSMKHAMSSMVELQFAAGAKQVMPLHMDAPLYQSWNQAKMNIQHLPAEPLRWQVMSAHVMGGCAMGTESDSRSVCDSSGRVYNSDSLSVLDASLFPTSLGVNPQLTIYAVVAKLASSLAIRLGGQVPVGNISVEE
ncbi:GMC family oxidoreductase [Aliikangiella sp. G2MR2-5]|uniref:GMC family oxidoreductase n=1 Tax=Aliikangiella sp. G2MR2-5 TaxID=2788943 RepID=UPI0018A96265|nr:GMC family oxidoreductase [Aliikangiella sp. G2MR2-5]